MSYECHITMIGDPAVLKPIVVKYGWHFSCIDGDPDLGDGLKCYATKHYPKTMLLEEVIEKLRNAWNSLAGSGCSVVRLKIEQILYDVKFKREFQKE